MTNSISLALSGGGARGFAHVGVIKTLIAEGIPIAEIAGTSMGAVVGAYYALHGDVAELEEFARKLTQKGMLRHFDPCMPHFSLIKGEKLRRILTVWFGDARLEDLKIPLTIVATDLAKGRPKLFRRGPLVNILMASCSIPGLLPPVKIDGNYYTDGGVVLQLPVAALRRKDTLRVGVGLPLFGTKAKLEREPRIAETIMLSFSIGGKQTAQDYRKMLRGGVLLLPETGTVGETLSFNRSLEFIRNGETAARDALSDIRKKLEPKLEP
jgi:NTE family protein